MYECTTLTANRIIYHYKMFEIMTGMKNLCNRFQPKYQCKAKSDQKYVQVLLTLTVGCR